jgi:hypothetical protein
MWFIKIRLHAQNLKKSLPYGPPPPGLNKNRVLTLKMVARCESKVFRVQPNLTKRLGVGLIFGPFPLKYLIDLAIMIANNHLGTNN